MALRGSQYCFTLRRIDPIADYAEGVTRIVELNLGVVCDHAHLDRSGKLSIVGIFDVIHASSFPHRWPMMHLVLRFSLHRSEAKKMHDVEVKVADEDGKELARITAQFSAEPGKIRGLPLQVSLPVPIANAVFPHAGTYSFDVLVDGRFEGSVPLHLNEMAGR